MLGAPNICRPAVLSLDEPKCKDVGGLACLGGLTTTPIFGQPGQVQVPAQTEKSEEEAPEKLASSQAVNIPVSDEQEPSQGKQSQAVGAYSGKTNSAGAFIAGFILIIGLVAVIVFIANRPPGKPISGSKLRSWVDDHVGALKKLEQTIQNIDKKRKQ